MSLTNFFVTGICCFIVYIIKSKIINSPAPSYSFSKLTTKAERDALDREIKEQEERAKARRARKQNTYSSSTNDEYYENSNSDDYEDSETVDDSQESSNQEKTQNYEKPKTPEIKYYCKYCGIEYSRVSDLTYYSCSRHPSGPNKGKHSLYHGDTNPPFYCKYCGIEYSRLSDLTYYSCSRHPNKGKHAPYEGFKKDPWICDNCGRTYSRLSDLTYYSCTKSPFGPNKGKHIPAN